MNTSMKVAAVGLGLALFATAAAGHPGHSDSAEAADVPDAIGAITSSYAFAYRDAQAKQRGGGQAENDAENEVEIEVRGEHRYITANGIPDHTPGRFPNRGNPNTISPQRYRYRVPASPEAADEISPSERSVFGVAINGVPFDPGTAEIWSPGDVDGPQRRGPQHGRRSSWHYEALTGHVSLGMDDSNAHVQPTGAYHYHGVPVGLVELSMEDPDTPEMVLLGYAADGFPIYAHWGYSDVDDASSGLQVLTSSYRVKEGERTGDGQTAPDGAYDGKFAQDFEYVEGLGELDECNGRTGVTPENPDGTYYYVLTEDYPFIPRFFRGTPDASFAKHGGPGGPGGPGEEGRPPRRGGAGRDDGSPPRRR